VPGFRLDLLWEVEPGTKNVYRFADYLSPPFGPDTIRLSSWTVWQGHPEVLIDYLKENVFGNANPFMFLPPQMKFRG